MQRDTPTLPCEPDKGSPTKRLTTLEMLNPTKDAVTLRNALSNEVAYVKKSLRSTNPDNAPMVDSLLSRLHTLLKLRGNP
jgi:hypothetical protein